MKKLQIPIYILLILSLLAMPLVGCAKAPTLTIKEPASGTTVTEAEITVRGTVSDPKATVRVNDVKVNVGSSGSFSKKVTLKEGVNTIKVWAIRSKKSVTKTITVTYAPPPTLSLEIISPENEAALTESFVVVTGTVSASAATVTVNNVEIEVSQDGAFSAEVGLTEGENEIIVMAVLDDLTATKTLTVFYEPEEESAQSFASSFEKDMEGWEVNGTDLDDPPVEWTIERSEAIASYGETSVMLYLNNTNGAGKIWIEREFEAEPNHTYEVSVDYDLASADWGDVNLWTIITGVVPESANIELASQGDTGNDASPEDGFVWLSKSYAFTAESDTEGELLVVIGVWGTWETARTYYLDNIEVTY